MALNIRNAKAEHLAAEIARHTGQTKTRAVIDALQERLAHLHRTQCRADLASELTEIAHQCAQLPVHDARDPDAILGYDEKGLPH